MWWSLFRRFRDMLIFLLQWRVFWRRLRLRWPRGSRVTVPGILKTIPRVKDALKKKHVRLWSGDDCTRTIIQPTVLWLISLPSQGLALACTFTDKHKITMINFSRYRHCREGSCIFSALLRVLALSWRAGAGWRAMFERRCTYARSIFDTPSIQSIEYFSYSEYWEY